MSDALDPFAFGGRADPVLVLAAERERLIQKWGPLQTAADAIMLALPRGGPIDDPEYLAACARADELVHAWCSIEDQLMETAATSAAGVLVQLEIFAGDVKWHEVPSERIDALIAVISASVHAIGGAQ